MKTAESYRTQMIVLEACGSKPALTATDPLELTSPRWADNPLGVGTLQTQQSTHRVLHMQMCGVSAM